MRPWIGRATALFLLACVCCTESTEPPASEPSIPDIRWALPKRSGKTPLRINPGAPGDTAMATLRRVVLDHGRNPRIPWAITHALLALGLDVELTNGKGAVEFLFTEYAGITDLGDGKQGIGFPLRTRRPGIDPATGQPRAVEILVEPHPELILKVLVERGAKPSRQVQVNGKTFTLGDLYRNCMVRSWVKGGLVSHASWNNNAWGLRALAGWAPAGLEWKALDGRAMSIDKFAHSALVNLSSRLASRRAAMLMGGRPPSGDSGLHSYSCGGAHYVDALGFALRRGFGSDSDREQFRADLKVIFWEYPRRIDWLDAYRKAKPNEAAMVDQQRFKWIGHFVELSFKMAAIGAFEPDEAQKQMMAGAVKELVVLTLRLDRDGVFAAMPEMAKTNPQMYLDYIGDSAHALYGLQIATGQLAVAY